MRVLAAPGERFASGKGDFVSDLVVKSNIHYGDRIGRPRLSRSDPFGPIAGPGRALARSIPLLKGTSDGRNQGQAHSGSCQTDMVRPLSTATVRPVPGVPHGHCGDESHDRESRD
jgi:hypothetical protein